MNANAKFWTIVVNNLKSGLYESRMAEYQAAMSHSPVWAKQQIAEFTGAIERAESKLQTALNRQ